MTLQADRVAPSGLAEVTDRGVVVPAATGPLVVSFDGQYVWSFTPGRDGRPHRKGVLVPWPPVLGRFLTGVARVRVSDPAGSRVLHDGEVVLGEGRGRIAIVDSQGIALCVDKVGHLTRAFSATGEQVRQEILRGTGRALDDLREGCGVTAYLSYGALLGAVRDGAMIAHDSDVDLCYVSRHQSPADLIAESYRIERVLRARGWTLLRMSGGDLKLMLRLSDGRQCQIDVFVAFWVAGTFFQLGNRSGRLDPAAVLPTSTVTLHGHEFAAPADPEAMLEFVYGPTWRVPDPSFAYADPLAGIRRLDGWLRGFRDRVPGWTEFQQGQGRPAGVRRSGFARWVDRQLPPGEAIAELGSGGGRDAVWFARRGRPVRAYDFTHVARGQLRRAAARRGLDVRVEELILGELRTVLLAGAELSRSRHHLYARELVGCLNAEERANLWRLGSMSLREGGRLFLEFSAVDPDGRALPAPGPAGLVRRVPPALVRAEVEAAGGVVELERLRVGEDSLGRVDPVVCRMRIAWPDRRASTSKEEMQ